MKSLQLHRRYTTCLVVLTVLLGTLMPTLSRCLVSLAAQTLPTTILCSGLGAKFERVAPMQTNREPSKDSVMSRCPLCLLHADVHGLPPASALLVLLTGRLADVVPRLFLLAPRASHSWGVALARAPPVSHLV